MAKKFVPEGVYLACKKGTCASQLRVSNHEKTTIYGAAMATEADIFPFFNLKPMGFCTDPSKILATGVMCVPTITKWENPQEGIAINGNKMLLEDSSCKCILGNGDISIHFDIASANQVAVWGGVKMPSEYIKEGFDWIFADMEQSRAIRDANAPDWMQGINHVNDWFTDLGVSLVEGAVTGVVGLGEVIYQVAQDPVGMAEAVGGMLNKADQWVKQKEMEAMLWASDGENWSNAADSIWKTTTETDWVQASSDAVSNTWEGTKKAASWVAKNPRKIGNTLGEFIPDAVAVAYTAGGSLAATGLKKAGKKVIKEVTEEVGEKALKHTTKEANEIAASIIQKKALKEAAEVAAKKKADDIAKVVTKGSDDILSKQKKLIDDVENGKIELEGYNGHKKGNHTRKSNYGEMKMDEHMKNLGYEPLHKQIGNIDQSISKGIDGVYKNPGPPPKYAIGEAKYDTSKLSQKAKDGPQMSDDWLEGSDRLEKAVSEEMYREIQLSKMLDPNSVEKVIVHTDKAGKATAKVVETTTKVNKAGETVKITKSGAGWP